MERMKDFKNHLERLAVEAAECEIIAKLATDPSKRDTFERLARQYRSMLEDLQADLNKRPK